MARRVTRLPPPEGMRFCPKCQKNLPISEFKAYPSYTDGIDPYCITHRKEARDASRKTVRKLSEPPYHKRVMAELEKNGSVKTSTNILLRVVAYYLDSEKYPYTADKLRKVADEMDSDVREAPDEDSGS